VRLKQMTATESQSLVRIYESGINGYTYLERDIPSSEG
jgi:arginine decarboxylase-like protein